MAAKNRFELSKEQRRAADSFGRQTCVSAGAGSGKTRVLVEHYLDALTKHGASVENILAVTFTERAANQMKERLIKRLGGLGRIDDRRAMENAWIGTIHGFCARVLRENPVECGVDPSFTVLGEGEAAILAKRTLDELFEEESGNAGWTSWMADHGERVVRESFTAAYDLFRAGGGDEALFRFGPSGAEAKTEFKRLFFRWKEKLGSEKRALSAYDFEDLLSLVHAAFSSSELPKQAVRRRYQNLFRHIFVDEFQDTSRIQWCILELLKQKDNLFAVGDAQQSIYRFRQAEPQIFHAVKKDSTVHPLRENYRSRAEILSFLNALFEPLFGKNFQALEPAHRYEQKKSHCLELINVEQGEMRLDEARVLEARTIARRVRELVDGALKIEDRETGSLRPAEYRDIAILMQKSTNVRYYEKELEELSIPTFVQKGRGFYEQHEVSDLLHFLRLVEDPSAANDVSAAAVLRSPLAGVSEDALFWLAELRRRLKLGSFMEAASRFGEAAELAIDDRAKLAEFNRVLESARKAKQRLKLSELLERVLDETVYEAKVLTRSGGLQASANVRKLVDMAARAEEETLSGVRGFIDWMESLSQEEALEPEARLAGERENVVRLLTVHAAKGLEFPCVVLADLGARKKNESKPCFRMDAAHGLGAKTRGADGEFAEDEAYAAISAVKQREDAEERNRLLYVALTRAEQHLILSGADGGAWMQLVRGALGDGSKHSVLVHEIQKDPLKEKKKKAPSLAASLAVKTDGGPAGELEKRFEIVSKPYEALEDLTVSVLVTQKAPAFQTEILETELLEELLEDEDRLPRNEFGTLFHRIMDISARSADARPLPAELWTRLTAGLSPAEQAEMKQSFEGFWKSACGNSVKRAVKRYPELPFIYKTRHGILKGQMDLVFQEKGGEWTILDYKTNRFESEAEKEKTIAVYRWQLGLYALAFWKLYGEVPKKTVLYFTTLDEAVESSWSKADLEKMAADLEPWYRKALDF